MTDQERREYRQALDNLNRQREQLERLAASIDWARVRVLLDEGTDHAIRLDQLVAASHGGPAPKLTPGAQAILVRAARAARRD